MAIVEKNKTNERLVKMLVDQNAQLMKLVEKMLDQTAEFAKAQRVWFELFKPPQNPQRSTALAEREAAREGDKSDQWTEMDAQRMIKDLMLETNYGDIGGNGDLM